MNENQKFGKSWLSYYQPFFLCGRGRTRTAATHTSTIVIDKAMSIWSAVLLMILHLLLFNDAFIILSLFMSSTLSWTSILTSTDVQQQVQEVAKPAVLMKSLNTSQFDFVDDQRVHLVNNLYHVAIVLGVDGANNGPSTEHGYRWRSKRDRKRRAAKRRRLLRTRQNEVVMTPETWAGAKQSAKSTMMSSRPSLTNLRTLFNETAQHNVGSPDNVAAFWNKSEVDGTWKRNGHELGHWSLVNGKGSNYGQFVKIDPTNPMNVSYQAEPEVVRAKIREPRLRRKSVPILRGDSLYNVQKIPIHRVRAVTAHEPGLLYHTKVDPFAATNFGFGEQLLRPPHRRRALTLDKDSLSIYRPLAKQKNDKRANVNTSTTAVWPPGLKLAPRLIPPTAGVSEPISIPGRTGKKSAWSIPPQQYGRPKIGRLFKPPQQYGRSFKPLKLL